MQELEKLTEMKKEGLIDDAEFKQMKKEILGK
ncbi:MAG: SHOCT domain-containing protein [Candidatus Poseidoniia archaeon]|nr:SHOCT domain-containing protein [Candidatus Poseidoniia archaeon]